jgi:hypothetical protein
MTWPSTPFFAFCLWVSRPAAEVHFFKRVFDIYFAPEIIKFCCDFGRAGPQLWSTFMKLYRELSESAENTAP